MKKTIETVQSLRLKGAPISSSIINTISKGIVIASNRMLLVENGGHLSFSDSWARNIRNEMERNGKKMKRPMATTCKIPVSPALLEEEKFTFQRNIITLVKKHKIPEELILNYDQTPFSYACTSNTTLDVRGSKSVPIVGKGKQKQVTDTFTVSADGDFLLMQLIYAGKTDRCHPNGINFPERFNITHTPNHWTCEKSAVEHLEKWYSRICQRNENSLKCQKIKKLCQYLMFSKVKQCNKSKVSFWQIDNCICLCAEKPHKSLSTIGS